MLSINIYTFLQLFVHISGHNNSFFISLIVIVFIYFRYSYFYLLNEAHLLNESLPQKKIKNYEIGKLKFYAATFVEVVHHVLKNVLKEIVKNKIHRSKSFKDIIIIHYGSWDASYRYNNLKQDIFKDFIPNLKQLAKTLNHTMENITYNNIQLIWATTPSSPYKHRN